MINISDFILNYWVNLPSSSVFIKKHKHKIKSSAYLQIAAFDFINKRLGELIHKFVKIALIKRFMKACIKNSNENI